MKEGKGFAIAGVAVAVAVGLFLILKPKDAKASPAPTPTPTPNVDDSCPDMPTFKKCPNWEQTKKCYNPLLVNPNTGLNPNGTNPCAVQQNTYDYGYDYETGQPNWMPDK